MDTTCIVTVLIRTTSCDGECVYQNCDNTSVYQNCDSISVVSSHAERLRCVLVRHWWTQSVLRL